MRSASWTAPSPPFKPGAKTHARLKDPISGRESVNIREHPEVIPEHDLIITATPALLTPSPDSSNIKEEVLPRDSKGGRLVPKEVFSATLGNIKIYTQDELKKLLSMPEGELLKKLRDGSLKAQRIKDAWYLPEEVIAEQRKLTTRVAAAGGRAKESRRVRNTVAALSAAAVLLVAAIASYNIFGPEPVEATGCGAQGLDKMVLRSIASAPMMDGITQAIKEACSKEALSGDADAYARCTVFVKRPYIGLVEIGMLEDVTSITESESGYSCSATLEAVASFPIEYTVSVDDGYARSVSVSIVR
jgi:hypothetical protein